MHSKPQIEALLASVNSHTQAFANARRLYADQLAPDFSFFQFQPPDELHLSRILA